MNHNQAAAYYSYMDVTGDTYAPGDWHADPYNNPPTQPQQHPVGAAEAAYGAQISQQYGVPARSSYPLAVRPQMPAPSYERISPAHGLQPAGQYAAVAAAAQRQHPVASAPALPYQHPMDDSLKSVKDLPAVFQALHNFRYFNPVQSECFDVAYKTDTNMVISAPTGAGKTGVMELAMLRLLSKHLNPAKHAEGQQQQRFEPVHGNHKIVYIGPIKALVQERHNDWQARYGGNLGLKCVQLTGDVDDDQLDDELDTADIICSTPEKFDQVTRKVKEKGKMSFFAQLGLVLLDEVHLLNEAGRGSSLEAGCVGRIKAVATVPEMSKAEIASVRFVAVSATIPNIRDLATWLNVPPAGIKQYGDELRPCKLTTHVKGYNPAKNDFLFERRLNEYVYGIVVGYSNNKPALVFCNSRKGTADTAAMLAKEAATQSNSTTGSVFIKTIPQLQRLQQAAAQAKAKGLAAVLVAGIGFHNAAMEPEDRELVESLFKSTDLPVLCTTSTLAMGVNLPAHLVVIKGTTRYVGDTEKAPGETTGYKEYTQTEVLQMVGRAGRPQFDNEGVAVIMTSKDSIRRYQSMMTGQPVESCLMANLAEHLNAELVLGTIQDVPGAIQWIKSSFLYTRVRSNPQHYGLAHKLKPGMSQTEVDGVLKSQLIMQPVSQLLEYGLASTDEDSYSLEATKAGKLMANHFLKLRTMAAIVKLGERPNMQSLLRVICGAEEFKNTTLRRCEKKVLNEINHTTDPQQLRYHVMAMRDDGTATGKVKERLSSPQEKLFLLLNDGLADKPCESLDYSLKQEQDRLLLVGQRIAKCMARYYIERNSFSAAGRSLLLARSLKAKLWDDSQVSARQVHGVGKLLAGRLAAAGLGSLKALLACNDAHQIEVAAQKPYPWGSELLSNLRRIIPPPVTMQIQVLGTLPNRAVRCQLTLARVDSTAGLAAAAATAVVGSTGSCQTSISNWAVPLNGSTAAAQVGSAAANDRVNRAYQTHTPCKLLCGCSSTDQLLLMRTVVLETFESPLQLTFKVDPPADPSQPIDVSARLVLDWYVGLDEKTRITIAPPAGFTAQQQRASSAASHAATADASSSDPVGIAVAADAAALDSSSLGSAVPGRRPAALQAAAAVGQGRKHTKRPLSSVLEASQEEQGNDQAAAAIKQRCNSARGRTAAQVLQERQQQQAQQRMQHAVRGNSVMTGAVTPAVQYFDADGGDTEVAAQGAATQLEAGPLPVRPVPRTAIAARYNRFLAPAAVRAGARLEQQQQQDAAMADRSRALKLDQADEAASAAVDAGELQVTPEHQRQLQQLASQQSSHGPQHEPQQQQMKQPQQSLLQVSGCQQMHESSRNCNSPDQQQQVMHEAAAEHQLARQQVRGAALQDSSQRQQQAGGASPSPRFEIGGGLSIAAMFDMLAEDEYAEDQDQEQQEQASSEQQNQLGTARPSEQLNQRSGMHSAAATANNQSQGLSSAAVRVADSSRHIDEAPAAGGFFGAAVLKNHATASALIATSQRSSATNMGATVSSLVQLRQGGMRSQPVGLGAHRIGASGLNSATMRSRVPAAAVPKPQLPQQQIRNNVSAMSAGTVEQQACSEAQFAAAAGAGAPEAVHSQHDDAGDMFTPPRQIVRSGHSIGVLYSGGSAAPANGNRSAQAQQQHHWQQQPRPDVQILQVPDGMEFEEYEDNQEGVQPPNLQQFAFKSGARPEAVAASYRPSQNQRMFQRIQAAPTASTASNRAAAQAKLAGRRSSRATSSNSSYAMPQLPQQGGYRRASMVPRAAGSYLGSAGYGQQEISRQQCSSAVQPPPALKVQWGGFVDEARPEDRLQAAKQARATWRPAVNGPAAQHLVIRTPTAVPQAAARFAIGVPVPYGIDASTMQQCETAVSSHSMLTDTSGFAAAAKPLLAAHTSRACGLASTAPCEAVAAVRAGRRQLGSFAAGSIRTSTSQACSSDAAVPAAARPTANVEMDKQPAPAEGLDDEDGGCVDFAGIFDFMKS